MSLEEIILGQLIIQPELFERVSIAEEIFERKEHMQIFTELKREFNAGFKVDIAVLADTLSGVVNPSFISGLLDGVAKRSPEDFAELIRQANLKRLKARLFKELEKEKQSLLKTGNENVLITENMRRLFCEIERLEASGYLSERKNEFPSTIEELAALDIPKIDWFIQPIIERFGYCLIGAQKGVGKSLFVTQLALYASSGCSPFLIEDIRIIKPLNVLLIQQEVSLPGMKDRLLKMQAERKFSTAGRFRQLTTTGAWWNLTNKDDYLKLVWLIEKHKPDLLILDPLYTFYPKELNTSGDISPMMEILSDLKSNFNLGLIVVHHFSNKQDADEIQQKSSVGRFMGHSMIANSADSTVGLDFLHPKYRQQTLPLPYQNYVTVDITTRHGEWPARFAIERKHGCLLFQKSTIWQDLGRSLVPGQIEEILEANDGQMLQKDLIEALAKEARRTTVRRAIDEAVNSGKVKKQVLQGKGLPVLLRLIK